MGRNLDIIAAELNSLTQGKRKGESSCSLVSFDNKNGAVVMFLPKKTSLDEHGKACPAQEAHRRNLPLFLVFYTPGNAHISVTHGNRLASFHITRTEVMDCETLLKLFESCDRNL